MANLRYIKLKINNFFRDNMLILIFILVCFIGGSIAGSVAANTLTYQQKTVLLNYLSGFITEVNELLSDNQQLMTRNVILANLKYALLFWVLAITLVGVVAIPLLIILRGFIVGFTSTFLIREMFFKGALLALTSIMPQNLILIPSLILGGFLSCIFVFRFGGGILTGRKYNLKRMLVGYSFSMVGVAFLLLLAALVEVYIVPYLLRLVEGIVI
jgi:stage II sporulation protein M